MEQHADIAELFSAREANHRIANNLALVSAMVRIQSRAVALLPSLTGPEVSDFLSKVSARIDAVGQLHRLLANAPGGADCAQYLREVCQHTLSGVGETGAVRFQFDLAEAGALPVEKLVPLGLFLSEAVVNSVKYAHPAGVRGEMAVRFYRTGPNGFMLEVADDGVGLPPGFDRSGDGGLGFGLMRTLAAQLQGQLELESDPLGLTIRLVVPETDPRFLT